MNDEDALWSAVLTAGRAYTNAHADLVTAETRLREARATHKAAKRAWKDHAATRKATR